MYLKKNINLIEQSIDDPKIGLPEEIFKLVSRITPLINVDLLIKDHSNKTLLTWRNPGETTAAGWHIPGGIVRYKENIVDRIHAVARQELEAEVSFKPMPIAINEIMLDQINRGHFISLLYSCELHNDLSQTLEFTGGTPSVGEWSWHDKPPKLLISPHLVYKKFF